MAKKKLADYQAKRDFKKTSEPSGKAKIRAAEYPRFIIQKHAATRLHYCASSMATSSSPGL
jgi:bifunctional non-homologous end joining protein LigD